MRHPWAFIVLLGLGLALAASSAARAQDFYGTGSSYTGQKVPIQTWNAIDAEKRRQSASDAQLRAQRQQLEIDRQRALTTGDKVDCVGKTAAQTNCATEPMPEFDRRANILKQDTTESQRQSEKRIKRLLDQP